MSIESAGRELFRSSSSEREAVIPRGISMDIRGGVLAVLIDRECFGHRADEDLCCELFFRGGEAERFVAFAVAIPSRRNCLKVFVRYDHYC